MRINPAEKIAGQSPLLIRKLLYRAIQSKWSVAFAAEVMGVGARTAKKAVEELEALGYIEKTTSESNSRRVMWKNTALGDHFAMSPASKPVTRATAERKIAEFLERVRAVRDNPYYLYRVERVTLFGSILSDKSSLGDVDIAVRLVHKEPDRQKASELDKQRRREASANGRRFNNDVDYLFWPKYEVFLFLKSRSTSLRLCPEDENFLQKCETKVIYEDFVSAP
jgi:DNA-binding MarR family transcriptional regulator